MKKGFNRLKGVATASVLGLGCLVAGSGRAAPVNLSNTGTTITIPLATDFLLNGANLSVDWGSIGASFTTDFAIEEASVRFTQATTAGLNLPVAYGDAFDGVLGFTVDGFSFANPSGVVDLTDNVLTSDVHVDIIPGIDAQVTFSFDAPTTAGSLGLVRALYSITNTSAAEIITPVIVGGNLGSDGDTTIQATSSGDLIADDADFWTYSNDQGVGNNPVFGNDPGLIITRYGTGASVVPVQTNVLGGGNDGFGNTYTLTIPAGDTQRIMVFIELQHENASATASATSFDSLLAASAASHLTGLSATQLSEIVNYDTTGVLVDVDLDGVLDADDNCPVNFNTDQADSNGNGIGDACDDSPTDTVTNPTIDLAASSSSGGGMSLPGLLTMLGLLPVLRLFRKTKR